MNTLLLLILTLSGASAHAADDASQRRATVQIHFVARDPDWSQPWQYSRQNSGTGSGVVIDGRRILTNAHMVSDSTYLTVRRPGDVKRWPAHVEFVAHDGETALLKVEDPEFFKGINPVVFGELPQQRDKLAVYGFPTGGTELSITEGVVSRVGAVVYSHSGRKLLTVQTDAAINAGNSGGPVFKDGKLVGIAFQHMVSPGSENIGYVVPIPMIRRFLEDVANEHYEGIPALGVSFQEMENPSMRRAYGLSENATGVLINKIQYDSSVWGILQPGDVLTRLAGTPIGQNGTVTLRGEERVDFGHLIASRQTGEEIEAEVVRERKLLKLKIRLKRLVELVPGPRHDVTPTYFILGGFVFMPLSEDFLRAHGGGTHRLRSIAGEEVATPERTQVVTLSQVLAHEVNRGFHGWSLLSVGKLNGKAIGSMKDLVSASRQPVDGRQLLEFESGSQAVLDAAAAADATPEIMKRYGVTKDRSADLP
ncbi:MAG: trypsin-like peptidase domain-containing protein [Elusimicrobiota bacterium]